LIPSTLEGFERFASGLDGQRQALAALAKESVRSLITPVGAAVFGAVPVAEIGEVAVFAGTEFTHPGCEAALSRALGRRVRLLRFDSRLIREAVIKHYLSARGPENGIDLPTFETPDFLDDSRCAARLVTEKAGKLPSREIEIQRGYFAFLDVRMKSVRRALDREHAADFVATPAALAFRITPEGATLFRDEMPERGVKAVASISVFYDGDEHLRAIAWRDVKSLPMVIHPSELQLAELEGRKATFWVYDRMEELVCPRWGRSPVRASWDCRYWFLSFGERFERTLRLEVLDFRLVPRSKITLAGERAAYTPDELARVFGLDFKGD
jgi:hypothetical protein